MFPPKASITCKICNTAAIYYHLNIKGSDIFYCKSCAVFIRAASYSDIELHLDGRGYTNLKNEELLRQKRNHFFDYILTTTSKYTTIVTAWLDFGCAYGHLLQKLHSRGVQAYGVEINKKLYDYCNSQGLQVFTAMETLPCNLYFDVISAIDSFYYDPEPIKTVTSFHRHLTDNGILILRITNLNWLMKCQKLFGLKLPYSGMGDAFIGYSKKAIERVLETGGFKIVKYQYAEKGKKQSLFHNLFYKVTYILSMLSFYKWPVTPGIIIIARKVTK